MSRGEGLRKKIAEARARRLAREVHAVNERLGSRELGEHLATDPARRPGGSRVGDDDDLLDADRGPGFTRGLDDRRALGADRAAVGGVLDIAAGEDLASGDPEGRAHLVLAVGAVGAL